MTIYKKYKVAIIGASGYTGSELARILVHHPEVEIVAITSESHAGKKFSDLHPQFTEILDLPLTKAEEVGALEPVVIFLALPHGISMEFVKKWHQRNAKIIDLSGDFRLKNVDVYQEWYKKEHTFPQGFDTAVYGLPELRKEQISKARLVANPGCYPTASILSLAPLFADNLIMQKSVVIDAKSGTTGAGIKPGLTTHFSNVNDNFKAYGISIHRHTVEIEEQFEALNTENVQIQFTPHLLPVDRGILVTAYASLKDAGSMDQTKLSEMYEKFYRNAPFVRIRQHPPAIKDVRGSNFCDIYPFWDTRTQRCVVIAVIDNLVKGASGQAVQNMNLMLGLEQTIGLKQIPIQP
ncbi:MAG TPA: N-acetyl-gamma-glutamyl-phosphate reductase [Cyclobacteriaceae bacterium]|nr:N-acetyl-gamma-glutamyl-phosphate reductase [Cyclobacteriaceae bacterium]